MIQQIMTGESHLSFSALKAFLDSPKHFYKYKMEKETTEAMEKGKRFHMAVLEPEKFDKTYWVFDDTEKVNEILANGYLDAKGVKKSTTSPRSVKPYKEWKSEVLASNIDREHIDKAEYETYTKMRNYLYLNEQTKPLMEGLKHKEKAFEFNQDGFVIKGQIDGEGDDYTIDLKKVADAKYKKIRWTIIDDLHHMQAAIYPTAAKKSKHLNIYIDEGCNVTVINFQESKLQEGFELFEFSLEKFTECAEGDMWQCSYDFYNGGYVNI